jgi:uncharacterized membrane protein required for colicin V production
VLPVTIDILTVAFLFLMAFFGWKRGLISQVVTLGSAALLWFTKETWLGPMGNFLAKTGSALADNFFLRDMASSCLLFGALLLTAWIIEKKIVEKSGPLRWSNHWGGALLGLSKGVIYATVLLWMTQAGALWKQSPGETGPDWLEQSVLVDLVGPWNPVRMFTLRELIDEMKLRATASEDTRQAASNETEGASDGDTGAPAAGATERDRALRNSTSLQELVEAVKNDPNWATASYRRLLDDPRVKQIIDDPELGEMLFGN